MALPKRSASTETATEIPAAHDHLKLLPKPGRPSLLGPERTAAICAIIEEEGISDSAAGALAGVTSSTLARWKVEQEGFALELERARALFELAQVRAIRAARRRDGSPDWRAAAWLLKQSSAEGFRPKPRMRGGKARGQTQGTELFQAGAALDEKCAILPETPVAAVGRAVKEGDVRATGSVMDGAEQMKNYAILPETPAAVGGQEVRTGDVGTGESGMSETTPLKNCAIFPETRDDNAPQQSPAGQRLSRRERRAEERRLRNAQRRAA